MYQVYFNPFGTFQDMVWTGIHYKKLLRGDNSINIHSRIMVLVQCPAIIAIYKPSFI